MHKSTFVLFLLSSFLVSCIEEFKLTESEDAGFIPNMVIEGHILSGDQSIIYVSQTLPFGSVEKPESIINALVTIVGENGYETEKAEFDIENDRYVIPTHDLPMDTHYAIRVEVDGEIYQSEFQPIQRANLIDEVFYKENENGIDIHISSHGEKSNSPYYMWTYEEDWEIHPSVDVAYSGRGSWSYSTKLYPDLEEGKNPYYDCWGKNYSSLIHIYNTSNLTQNTVKEHKLLTIPWEDNRVSYLYSIFIKQASLNEDSYKYYYAQRQYSEGSSGLFTPMPTEVKGNVKCLSNPQTKVLGYVIASQVATKRIFIDADDLSQEYFGEGICTISQSIDPIDYKKFTAMAGNWIREMNENGAFIWNEVKGNIDANSLLYSRPCVDCRAFPYSTQKCPDFWPNDHE